LEISTDLAAETQIGNPGLKLKILCERLLIIPLRFFGIPPFRFYALVDGIHKLLSQTSPETSGPPPKTWQLELLLAWEG
jgi:hypothetical protein